MRVLGLLVVLGLIAFGAYYLHAASARPVVVMGDYVPGPSIKADLKPETKQLIARILTEQFGDPRAPKCPEALAKALFKIPGQRTVADHLRQGIDSYHRRCLHCHGLSGDGRGPTAPFLLPRPRDFRTGTFKFTSTPSGVKATRDDLERILLNGVPGTVMPSFKLDPKEDIDATLDYILLLAARGEVEGLLVLKDDEEGLAADSLQDAFDEALGIVLRKWTEAATQTLKPKEARPPVTPEAVARGRDLFLKDNQAKCAECHGAEGTGRTPSTISADGRWLLKPDEWGNPTLPADLTKGIYRGGRRPIDLFWRIRAGIKGTPMPSFDHLTDAQVWDLVAYVQSLAR